jgi:hypothetical protein
VQQKARQRLAAAGFGSRINPDRSNLAPRLGLAWAPRDRTNVFRAAYGLFYGTTPASIPTLAKEYERAAYDYPRHEKSAEAGYAALLAYAQLEKSVKGEDLRALRRRSVDSSVRFAEANPNDARAPGVLTDAAEKLYAANESASILRMMCPR